MEGINEFWYFYEMQYDTAVQMNMLQLHALSQLNLKSIIFNGQAKAKITSNMISLIKQNIICKIKQDGN